MIDEINIWLEIFQTIVLFVAMGLAAISAITAALAKITSDSIGGVK